MKMRCKRKHLTKMDLSDSSGDFCVINFDSLFVGTVALRIKRDGSSLFVEIDVDGCETL